MALAIKSKLPASGLSIFARMTAAAIEFDAINLAQGFPNFSPPTALFDYLLEACQNGFNQYAPMPGHPALRKQIAKRLESDYFFKANADSEITITAGATQAIYTLISAFIKPGDKAIIFEPAYDSYGPAIIVNGGIPIYLKLELPNFKIPWDALEKVLKSEKIKLLLINNPHNPAGRILTSEDLERLYQLTKDLDILLIWDEVYDLLVFDSNKHQSALQHPGLMEYSGVVFSMGKTLHNTGWKIGYTIAKSNITQEIRKLHQFTVFSVNTPAQYAIARFMEEQAIFFKTLPKFYEHKRDFFFEQMKHTTFEFLPCEGSYFALANIEKLTDKSDLEYAMELVEKSRVAVIPISAFYHDGFDPRMLRFCFAKTEDTILEAANRLGNRL
ncbi:MAG: methionine aminotransferase [Saprospiraceae bacterium]|nr:aminotransferase class I/II-fold pyridoxal phosphate-dependent enzyme [Saprospiraceae bacterium]